MSEREEFLEWLVVELQVGQKAAELSLDSHDEQVRSAERQRAAKVAESLDGVSISGKRIATAIRAVEPQQRYEYATTTGPRKAWDDPDRAPEGSGWELDPGRGRPGESWERFDYHEERYWRRPVESQQQRIRDLEATIARVREMHHEDAELEPLSVCNECMEPLPCPTLQALDASPEKGGQS